MLICVCPCHVFPFASHACRILKLAIFGEPIRKLGKGNMASAYILRTSLGPWQLWCGCLLLLELEELEELDDDLCLSLPCFPCRPSRLPALCQWFLMSAISRLGKQSGHYSLFMPLGSKWFIGLSLLLFDFSNWRLCERESVWEGMFCVASMVQLTQIFDPKRSKGTIAAWSYDFES